MFGNAPKALWSRWVKPDELNRIPLACRSFFIQIGSVKILLEAGIGAFFEPVLAERYGVQSPDRHLLLENLNQHNINPSEIDYVILSHLHFDHAGGLFPSHQEMSCGNRDLLFPNAKYIVGEAAWERAWSPHFRDKASFLPELNQALKDSQRCFVVKSEKSVDSVELPILPLDELPEEISFFESHGHTPGQLHTLIHGEKGTLVFCGDLVPGVPWVHLPITMGYDRFAEKVIDEKQALYDKALPASWTLLFTHDANYAGAQLAWDEKKKKYSACHLKEHFEADEF